jgi:hypothetical protein
MSKAGVRPYETSTPREAPGSAAAIGEVARSRSSPSKTPQTISPAEQSVAPPGIGPQAAQTLDWGSSRSTSNQSRHRSGRDL